MFTDRVAAAEESLTTQNCGRIDVSSTARSYGQLFSAGTYPAQHLNIINPASCLHHFLPRRDPVQSHLGLDHTNITQDHPPSQNSTVHSYKYGLSHYQHRLLHWYNCYFIAWTVCMYLFYCSYSLWFYCTLLFYSAIQLCCCNHVNKSSSSSSELHPAKDRSRMITPMFESNWSNP